MRFMCACSEQMGHEHYSALGAVVAPYMFRPTQHVGTCWCIDAADMQALSRLLETRGEAVCFSYDARYEPAFTLHFILKNEIPD